METAALIAGTPPPDVDSDDVPGATDNCPGVAYPDQCNIDRDGIGDICDEGSVSGSLKQLYDTTLKPLGDTYPEAESGLDMANQQLEDVRSRLKTLGY